MLPNASILKQMTWWPFNLSRTTQNQARQEIAILEKLKCLNPDTSNIVKWNGFSIKKIFKGGMVALWLALSPHSKKVLGLIPGWDRTFLCGVCVLFAWVFSRGSGFPHHQNMYIGVSPVSTLDQGTGLEPGVGSQALCCGCPLLLRDGLNTENTIPVKNLYFYFTFSPN